MIKRKADPGLLSTGLAVIPLPGLVLISWVSSANPDSEAIQVFMTIVLYGGVMMSPIIGLICGIYSFRAKPSSYRFPIIGTLLNAGWILFLSVTYIRLMLFYGT